MRVTTVPNLAYLLQRPPVVGQEDEPAPARRNGADKGTNVGLSRGWGAQRMKMGLLLCPQRAPRSNRHQNVGSKPAFNAQRNLQGQQGDGGGADDHVGIRQRLDLDLKAGREGGA